MARILRGEIRWADLNPVRGHGQAGERPVLILSHDVFNERSGTVFAVALASQAPTLSTERIGKRISRASAEDLDAVIEGLMEISG